jgi:predicted ATPase/class 3 adenylate cyclase
MREEIMAENFSFGYWLRRQRLARDLRQAELAGQLGIAPITLRKIEADERRPSLQLVARLAELLGLSEEERTTLLRVARADLSPAALSLPERAPDVEEGQTLADTPSAALPSGTVTFLFTDITGSTQLWERHSVAMRTALVQHDALLHAAIARHGGVVVKGMGDGLIAAFALAEDGLSAALDAQRAFTSAAWGETGPLQVRMALHSGAAEPQGDDYVGPTLNRAARLLAAGHGGQVLLSLAAAELLRDQLPADVQLRDLGAHRLKDLTRPEQILQLVTPDLPAEFPPLRTLEVRRHNLPTQATALIGREREVAELCALLRQPDVRLVTLLGPGGTGKTRLALQAAAELVETFPDGVWFVNLAPVTDPDLVLPTIAQAFDIRELGGRSLSTTLADALREQRLLLVLDNFEQVVTAASDLGPLLALAPGVTILVTSREALQLSGEHRVTVPPLALPDLRAIGVGEVSIAEEVSQYEAVRLFIERARVARADFTVTNANAPAVAEICVRLDGLPLAIELAAARVGLFTPEALLNRLERRLPMLTGGPRDRPARQQTLRDAITWSYALLNADEQHLLAQLAVFASGWTIAAAAAVAADDEIAVLDRLEALADKSLLRQSPAADGEPRFTMLETIREYCLELLEQRGGLAEAQARHAAYFLQWAEAAAFELNSPRKAAWCDLLEADHGNLRATLHWLHAQADYPALARLGSAIWRFWWIRGHWREGWRWLVQIERGLANQAAPEHTLLRARLLAGLTWMAIGVSDFRSGEAYAQESLRLSAGTNDLLSRADAWMGLAHATFGFSDLNRTMVAMREANGLYQAAGDLAGIAYTQNLIGSVQYLQGDLDAAQTSQEQALAIARTCGDLNSAGAALTDLGLLAAARHEFEAAEALLKEGMELRRTVGDRHGRSSDLTYLANIAIVQGKFAWAEELQREALELRRALGDRRGLVAALGNLARATRGQGDLAAALRWNNQGIDLAREIDYLNGYHWSLLIAAEIAAAGGQYGTVARLLGAAEGLRAAHNLLVDPDMWDGLARITAEARSALTEEEMDEAWAAGRALDIAGALAIATRPLGDGTKP